tara:strand:+ start:3866 stop:4972 length:1107 start_codon:yes stop_codon:yes gene_type:complete
MKKKLLFILSVILLVSSCEKSKDSLETDPLAEYRSELLYNVTNNIIIPAHETLQNKLDILSDKALDFSSNPTALTLSELRYAWVKAYMSWQSVEMFAIGKAEEIDYVKSMNTYPCSPVLINNNLESQSYDLNQSNYNSWKVQGFPALDYMLYGLDADSNMVLNYYQGTVATKYLAYVNDIISQMKINTDLVLQYWQTNKESFISSDGNTSTSSLNLLTNDFIYYYEKGLRANKIGIPCGVWNGFQEYEIGIEAYYQQDISKQLALESLNACKDFFTGKGINSEVLGFSYIDFLSANGDESLSADIINGLSEAEIAINNLDNNFRLQLMQDNLPMLDTYDELQDVVVLLKVNMLYSLNITVDYFDSDGD